jgi:hypothetical protein
VNAVLGLVASLLILGLPVAAVVLIVRAVRRGAPDEEHPNWSLRRFLHYSFLLASLVAAATGVTSLLQSALPEGERLAGRGAAELALGLSLTLVAVPVWGILWRLVRRRLAGNPDERASPAWLLYLTAVATVSLIVAFVDGVQVGGWALGAGEFDDRAVASTVAWAGVWGLHAWFLRHPALAPTHRLADVVPLAGSAVGVIGLALGVGGMLFAAFGEAYKAVAGTAFVERPATEALRQSMAVAALAAPVWWWHWLRQAVRAPRTTPWHVYVMLVPILGGLLTVVGSAAVGLHSLLQWFLGMPQAARAAVHFEPLPGALAGVLTAAWVWWYHRSVLGEAGGRRRTEPERTYEYLVAGVGLVAAASGVAVTAMAAIQAVAPAPLAATDPRGRNTLVVALTMLLVGAPLWWTFWHRLQARVQAGDRTEVGSPARRAYLLLLFGATGLTAVISLVVILFVVFRDALERTLAATALYELRAAIAFTLTAGGVSAYHWTVHREERAARRQEEVAAPRTVLLVSPDGHAVADQLRSRTGATVRTLHRVDVAPGPVDPEAVADAIRAFPQQRLLVIIDGDGTVRVIPYDIG